MGRLLGPKCRLCRREGQKLFLKGTRCETDKCGLARRDSPPGMHGYRRGKMSSYGEALREKQKTKRYYGVLERQFRRYFAEASRSKGNTSETLLSMLERRLDNVVFRMGLAVSRADARQMIVHGHIMLNGRKTDIPSLLVKVGDEISVSQRDRSVKKARAGLEASRGRPVPDWLQFDPATLKGSVKNLPTRDDVSLPVNERVIVELLSK
ncbi:MAG: 30S ribosomal protein S4 [Planctomycetota bacterium]|nr:30S ribosomal protein S4 [Planctomycetota bacterium]